MRRPIFPLLFLASTVAGQPTFYPGPIEHREWHSAIPGAAAFTGATSGHFQGHGYPDVVVLQGGKAHLLASPGAVNSLNEIPYGPTGCTAIASRFLQMSSKGRRLDQILVSHPGGVSQWLGGAMGFGLVLTDSIWQSARQLVVADVDADGIEDFVGLGAGVSGIIVQLGTATGYGEAFRLAGEALCVTTIQWDTSPAREIAVVTQDGLCIYDYTLTDAIDIGGTSCTEAILTTVRKPGAELLTLAAKNGTTWSLYIVDSLNPGSITLGALDLVACAAGDLDADGDDDLLFSKRSNHRATLLIQRPGYGFAYNPVDAMEAALIGSSLASSASAAPGNNATPVMVDVDGDGDADMLHPVESAKDLAIVRPPFGAPRSIVVLSTTESQLSQLEGELNAFKINTSFTKLPTFPAQATHIELAAWWLTGSVLGTETKLQAIHGPGGTRYARVDASITKISVQVPEDRFNVDHVLLMQFRPVQVAMVGSQEVIVRTFTPTTCYFASNDTPPLWPYQHRPLDFARSVANDHGSNQYEKEILRTDEEGGTSSLGGGGNGADASTEGKTRKDAKKGSGGAPGPSSAGGINGGGEIIINPPPPTGGGGTTGPG